MNLNNPRWADAAHTQVDAAWDTGEVIRISACPGIFYYDELVASGVMIAPFIPRVVTPRQARLALLAGGLLPQVEAAVASAGGATQITWDYASEIIRDDPLILTLAAALNLTSDQIDALFTTAATL